MDFSHVEKKIRNTILKSGIEAYCKRHLIYGDKFIEWNHFRKTYLWDISSSSFPVHHKLTKEHIFLTSVNKMRNHLAEDVLNSEMLHLMELYKESLGQAGLKLSATIELLKCTNVLINNFRDKRPITNISYERIQQNHDSMHWFIKWKNSVKSDEKIKNKEKHLIS